MNEYPSNSYKSKGETEPKPEDRKIEPVVSHEVKTRKKGPMQKFADAFIAEDLSSVKSYVIKELLIPGIKRMFLSSLEMLLNGKGYSSSKKDRQITTVSYRDYYEQQKKPTAYENVYLDFDDIYGIVTSNGFRTIKRIKKGSSKNTFTLVPANPDYESQEILKTMIMHIFKVLCAVKKF